MKLWAGCFSYYYALLGNEARISAPFREHHLSELNLLAPFGCENPAPLLLCRRWT